MPTSSDTAPTSVVQGGMSVAGAPDASLLYDEDYYERGVESGKSCYSNYRWLPDLTVPMAMTIIDTLAIPPGARVLDFGCAKGFVVKALRLLRRDAWGIDISPYAIGHTDAEVSRYCELVTDLDAWSRRARFDHVIAKDVLEHVPHGRLRPTLACLARVTNSLMVVVPLGDGRRYVIDAYERDITHVVREPAGWWADALAQHFDRVQWTHHVPGIKDNWQRVNARGNAVLFAASGAARDALMHGRGVA